MINIPENSSGFFSLIIYHKGFIFTQEEGGYRLLLTGHLHMIQKILVTMKMKKSLLNIVTQEQGGLSGLFLQVVFTCSR